MVRLLHPCSINQELYSSVPRNRTPKMTLIIREYTQIPLLQVFDNDANMKEWKTFGATAIVSDNEDLGDPGILYLKEIQPLGDYDILTSVFNGPYP